MNLIEAMETCVCEKENEHTRRAMRGDFRLYLYFLVKAVPQLSDLSIHNLARFKQMLLERDYSIKSIARTLQSLKSLAKWCNAKGFPVSTLEVVKIPKVHELRPQSLTPDEEVILRRAALRLVLGGKNGKDGQSKGEPRGSPPGNRASHWRSSNP